MFYFYIDNKDFRNYLKKLFFETVHKKDDSFVKASEGPMSISDCNGIRTQDSLVRKITLNHLVKWLSVTN